MHVPSRQRRQQLFQYVQGFHVRMAYADCKALSFREQYQPFELPGDLFALSCVVQKDVSFQMRNAMVCRRLFSDSLLGGAAIEKVKAAPLLERLHKPVHGLGLLGQQAAHMVADPRHIGHRCQIGMHGPDYLFSRHAPGQTARPQRPTCDRLHRQVEHDFAIVFVCQCRQVAGVGRAGKKRKRYPARQGDGAFTLVAPVSQIVDHQSHQGRHVGVGIRAQRDERQRRAERNQQVRDAALQRANLSWPVGWPAP